MQVIDLRPPEWEWSFFEDGALALDPHELWEEPVEPSATVVSQTRRRRPRLKPVLASVTVPGMPSPHARARGRGRRARGLRTAVDARSVASLAFVAAVVVLTLVLTAFGSSPTTASAEVAAAPSHLAPTGPPQPQIVALQGPLRLQLPISQPRVTAIGYHASEGALALEPLGKQGNRGLLGRIADRIFGSRRDGLVYYQLGGGSGPSTAALDVGAAPDTDVFSPVDGTVIGITGHELNGRQHGVRVDIQPTSAPSLVVSVTRLRRDPQLTVGSPVVAASSRLGAVLDLSGLERQALARYTQDAGNHVTLEVRPAPTLALP